MRTYITVIAITLGFWTGSALASDRVISVQGIAERSLDPNMLTVSVEVWGKATTAKQAQQLAAQQYRHLKKTFEEYKVKKEDIQTDNYTLSPEYEYDQKLRQNKMIGFRTSQTLLITLRSLDGTGAFLDALVPDKKTMDAGVNLNSINWDSDKRSQLEMASLGDAVRMARARADEIAKAAGVKIVNVAKINHSSTGGGGAPVMRSFGLKTAEASLGAPTEVAPGQIKVRVEVSADYLIN